MLARLAQRVATARPVSTYSLVASGLRGDRSRSWTGCAVGRCGAVFCLWVSALLITFV